MFQYYDNIIDSLIRGRDGVGFFSTLLLTLATCCNATRESATAFDDSLALRVFVSARKAQGKDASFDARHRIKEKIAMGSCNVARFGENSG